MGQLDTFMHAENSNVTSAVQMHFIFIKIASLWLKYPLVNAIVRQGCWIDIRAKFCRSKRRKRVCIPVFHAQLKFVGTGSRNID